MSDRGTAVVIEDDADIRGLLEILLTQSGFAVHAVSSGGDGVRAVSEHDPVLVTVDVGLPDIDGFEVVRRVRQTTDAYIVMLTGLSEEIDTLMGLESGADDYITKPFRPRELRARIEAMLRRPRSRASAPAATAPAAPARSEAPLGSTEPAESVDSERPAQLQSVPQGGNGVPPAAGQRQYRLDGLTLYPDLHQVTVDDRQVPLTRSEFVLLHTLMTARQTVRSKADLFRVLRQDDIDAGAFVGRADERTIEVHMGNLRRKIGEDSQHPRWIQTIRGVGYRLVATPHVIASD